MVLQVCDIVKLHLVSSSSRGLPKLSKFNLMYKTYTFSYPLPLQKLYNQPFSNGLFVMKMQKNGLNY